MKHLVGKDITKTVEFLDDKVQIRQLSVGAVMKLQEDLSTENAADSIDTLAKIIRVSVVGAEDMSQEDFESFPLAALMELSQEIMNFAGLKAEAGND